MDANLREQYGPWALIAGGSEGIGFEFGRRLAAGGINLLLIARREGPLNEAREKLLAEFDIEVRTASVDLTADDLETRLSELTDDLDVGMLVYNAGATHGADLFLDAPLSKARQLVSLNCLGPITLCHYLGGKMRERGRGGMILLSSMSGLSGGAYVSAYAATKSFDITFAESLWAELQPYGVHALALVTGATDTPAMARAGIDMANCSALTPQQVADEGLAALGEKPFHAVGEQNQAMVELVRGGDRAQLINMMSMGAASLFAKPYPLTGY